MGKSIIMTLIQPSHSNKLHITDLTKKNFLHFFFGHPPGRVYFPPLSTSNSGFPDAPGFVRQFANIMSPGISLNSSITPSSNACLITDTSGISQGSSTNFVLLVLKFYNQIYIVIVLPFFSFFYLVFLLFVFFCPLVLADNFGFFLDGMARDFSY